MSWKKTPELSDKTIEVLVEELQEEEELELQEVYSLKTLPLLFWIVKMM